MYISKVLLSARAKKTYLVHIFEKNSEITSQALPQKIIVHFFQKLFNFVEFHLKPSSSKRCFSLSLLFFHSCEFITFQKAKILFSLQTVFNSKNFKVFLTLFCLSKYYGLLQARSYPVPGAFRGFSKALVGFFSILRSEICPPVLCPQSRTGRTISACFCAY